MIEIPARSVLASKNEMVAVIVLRARTIEVAIIVVMIKPIAAKRKEWFLAGRPNLLATLSAEDRIHAACLARLATCRSCG